ncbi:MAG TPA: DUF2064 domain-containing protein [Flavisolibacter sp.]|nr:DUF2064 domain-containing protein [Flavisolibacter sp.]
MNNDTAILLFSRLPREEASVKGYGSTLGKKAALELAKGMVRSALHTAYASGYPVFPILSDKQRGQTFGERLANSIEEVYHKGYAKVIVIGSDCPTLSAAILQRAATGLQSDNLIAGPCSDGGVYLIGIHKDSYRRSMFLDIAWGTASVLHQLQQAAACAALAFVTEEIKADIDNSSDLFTWYHSHNRHPLSLLLTRLIASLMRTWCSLLRLSIPSSIYIARPFRGPPVVHTF